MLKRITSLLLAAMLLCLCFTAFAESTLKNTISVPALKDLALSYERGSNHSRVTLLMGEEELLYFGVEYLDGEPYAVSNLLEGEIRLDTASLKRLAESYGIIAFLDQQFHFTEESTGAAQAEEQSAAAEEPSVFEVAFSEIDWDDVQYIHTLLYVSDLVKRKPTELTESEGTTTRVLTYTPEDIQGLFTAVKEDLLSSTEVMHALNSLLEQTPLYMFGYHAENFVNLLDVLGAALAGALQSDLKITTVSDQGRLSAFSIAEFTVDIFGIVRRVTLSYETVTLDESTAAALEQVYGGDFTGYDSLGGVQLSLASTDGSSHSIFTFAALSGLGGESYSVTQFQGLREGKMTSLVKLETNFNLYTENEKEFAHTSLCLQTTGNNRVTLDILRDVAENTSSVVLGVNDNRYEVSFASAQYERENYEFINPLDLGAMAEKEYANWQSNVLSTLLLNLGMAAVKVPLHIFNINLFSVAGWVTSLFQ